MGGVWIGPFQVVFSLSCHLKIASQQKERFGENCISWGKKRCSQRYMLDRWSPSWHFTRTAPSWKFCHTHRGFFSFHVVKVNFPNLDPMIPGKDRRKSWSLQSFCSHVDWWDPRLLNSRALSVKQSMCFLRSKDLNKCPKSHTPIYMYRKIKPSTAKRLILNLPSYHHASDPQVICIYMSIRSDQLGTSWNKGHLSDINLKSWYFDYRKYRYIPTWNLVVYLS